MHKEDRKGHSWFVWNAANFITIGRTVGIFMVLFPFDFRVEAKLIAYVALEFTDAFDGPVARWVGNADGRGKYIDTILDKVNKVFIILFLIHEKILDMWMNVAMLSGETIALGVGIIGICLTVQHQRVMAGYRSLSWENCREVLGKSEKVVRAKWKIYKSARTALILYAVVVIGVFAHRIAPSNLLVEPVYLAVFVTALAFRAFSIIEYGLYVYNEYRKVFVGGS